ncbi:hypothetical protein [Streptomyces sp. NPDC053069]|uniref:hypothetical protein n=1 Tax=Streptomyces sp. NPDC053069 TaxID=3365695 RepID=UPI0037D2AC52
MDRNVEVLASLASYREAALLLTTAVLRDGRAEASERPAQAYGHQAALVRNHKDPLRALAPARRAIAIRDRLVLLEVLAGWGTLPVEGLRKLAETFRETDRLVEAQETLGCSVTRNGRDRRSRRASRWTRTAGSPRPTGRMSRASPSGCGACWA